MYAVLNLSEMAPKFRIVICVIGDLRAALHATYAGVCMIYLRTALTYLFPAPVVFIKPKAKGNLCTTAVLFCTVYTKLIFHCIALPSWAEFCAPV